MRQCRRSFVCQKRSGKKRKMGKEVASMIYLKKAHQHSALGVKTEDSVFYFTAEFFPLALS